MLLTDQEESAVVVLGECLGDLLLVTESIRDTAGRAASKIVLPVDRLTLGVLTMVLKSILADMRAVELLALTGYPAGAATVASALFEKSVIGRYLLRSPEDRIHTYLGHGTKRNLPWSIRSMLPELVLDGPHDGRDQGLEAEMEYLQYVLLCSIKHPQASSVTFAAQAHGRPETLTQSLPAIPRRVHGITLIVVSLAASAALDFLRSYATSFCGPHFAATVDGENERLRCLLNTMSDLTDPLIPPLLQLGDQDASPAVIAHLSQILGLHRAEDG